MSKSKYQISKEALIDLDEIWIYTFHKWQRVQADRYFNLIIGEIEFIAVNFPIGKAVQYGQQGYHMLAIKSHLIFYRIAENEMIKIVRILHKKIDIKRRLSKNKTLLCDFHY
jgi:toxin ParE1/3/4